MLVASSRRSAASLSPRASVPAPGRGARSWAQSPGPARTGAPLGARAGERPRRREGGSPQARPLSAPRSAGSGPAPASQAPGSREPRGPPGPSGRRRPQPPDPRPPAPAPAPSGRGGSGPGRGGFTAEPGLRHCPRGPSGGRAGLAPLRPPGARWFPSARLPQAGGRASGPCPRGAAALPGAQTGPRRGPEALRGRRGGPRPRPPAPAQPLPSRRREAGGRSRGRAEGREEAVL